MKKNPPELSVIQSRLRLENGVLFWINSGHGRKAGQIAGSKNKEGYIQLGFDRHTLLAHRVVWLLTYGEWPPEMIDHINCNKTDNRPCNLRLADNSANQANKPIRSGKSFKGITFHKKTGKFQAQCGGVYIGLFRTKAEAAAAYDQQALSAYGEYARLNFHPIQVHT